MNLVLAHCGKEWRAQRGLLVAYSLLVFSCLALGLWLAPMHAWSDEGSGGRAWFEEGLGMHAVTWFFTAGVLGVLLFVAPNLVRAEFGSKDDQFVRRLPGALAPSFGGKALFLLLAAAALPLLGLLLGEIYVAGRGHTWNGLFEWRWDGEVALRWPGVVIGCGYAMLLVPWIWAIGTWLPGGRMAVGGTVLFVLLAGVCVFAVLRQSPAIERHIGWQPWLWWVAPLGVLAAAVSWCRGRSGGGPLRSARFGLAAAAVGLVPPSAWFASEAWAYHHPDLAHLAELSVQGLSPDGRYALARGATHQAWDTVSLRIDLDTGRAEQITGTATVLTPEIVRCYLGHLGRCRWWRHYDERGDLPETFDLQAGAWTAVALDEQRAIALTAEQRAQLFAELRERTSLRAPGGRRVWFEDDLLCSAEVDGTVTRAPWAGDRRRAVRPAGHGFFAYAKDTVLFDCGGRKVMDAKTIKDNQAWIVRDAVVFVPSTDSGAHWSRRIGDGAPEPCEALAACSVLGLFDDDRLLCSRSLRKKGEPPRLFLYRPADHATADLLAPRAIVAGTWIGVAAPLYERGSLLPRDPAGCIWLSSSDNHGETFLRLDTVSCGITAVLPHRCGDGSSYQLLAWPDARTALVAQDAEILRFDITTGERTVLFPRR